MVQTDERILAIVRCSRSRVEEVSSSKLEDQENVKVSICMRGSRGGRAGGLEGGGLGFCKMQVRIP